MKLNIIPNVWPVVAIPAGFLLFLYLGFHFFRKKKNSSSYDVIENPNHTTPISTATAAISASRPQCRNYEVFLNFRGTDTRTTFTDHLYHRLERVGVCVFRDDEELCVGEEIHPNLLAAIQTSKITIPIISPDYASSKWCLLELVHILKCRETLGQIVLPVFYHISPSDVRNQKGTIGKAFSLHNKNHSSENIQEWKDALKIVTSLKGLELKNDADGYEGKLINQVVDKILADLRKTFVVVPEILIGVKEQAKKIMERIDEKSSNDVQVVLIHGMGGIGKTTLAKFLFNQLCSHFQFRCFLEIGRETPTQQLQMQLISETLGKKWPWDIYHPDEGTSIINNTFEGTKVLLVLDDVDNGDRLDALMGKHDQFGQGSIIIITSRNSNVLKQRHAKLIHEMRELDFNQSFQLFRKYALQREDHHYGEYKTIARDIVSTTGGLPLAIVVIGSFLWHKEMDIWKETSKKLRRIPNDEVQSKLKISYDALTYEQKKIFLDIACLFPSTPESENFMYMWDDCEYYPRFGIEVLKSLSLIKVRSGNKLSMHDQLRKLGREIIRQQGRDLPGKRSLLWNQQEACQVLESDQVTEQIEVLNLISDKRCEENCFTNEQFERLTRLRILQMRDANLFGNFKNCFLNLRWLQWYGCPPSFKAINFRPRNLVILDLSESNITEQWGGWNEMKYAEKLKVLKLRKCSQLKVAPDFSTFKELEILDLSYCKRLKRIHEMKCAEKLKVLQLGGCFQLKSTPDFSTFKKLEILSLFNCTRLKRIHPSISRLTKTLKTLDLAGCEELEELPIEMGTMEELRYLNLSWTSIREIPVVEGFMTKLKSLYAFRCKKLVRLPDAIGSLTKLEKLHVTGCVSLTTIPESIGKLKSLKRLSLNDTNIKELPESIGKLHNLKSFRISGTNLIRLPAAIGMLEKLEIFFGPNRLTEVPMEIGESTHLRSLFLGSAPISRLPNLPSGLRILCFSGCSMESLPKFSHLTNLIELSLRDVDVMPELPSSLRTLSFDGCRTLRTLSSVSNLKYLIDLTIEDCPELMEINALEEMKYLESLKITNCRKISKLGGVGNSLKRLTLSSCDGLKCLPDLSTLKYLTGLRVVGCNNIVEIQGLNSIKQLKLFDIHDCSSLERIGNFSHLTTLEALGFGNCPKLSDIDYPCIDIFTSLKNLRLFGGSPVLELPDLSKLSNLRCLCIKNFEELREVPKLQELKSLVVLSIFGCKSLENLPDFSEFKDLIALNAQGCEKLTEFKGLDYSSFHFELYIFGCRSLKRLPKLREGSIFKQKTEHRWSTWWFM